MNRKVCERCGEPKSEMFVGKCKCGGEFVEAKELALRLQKEDLDAIAKVVSESVIHNELGRLGKHLKESMTLRDWSFVVWNLTTTKMFWAIWLIIAVLFIGLACLTVWKSIPVVVKNKAERMLNTEFRSQIEAQLKEPRISNLMASVVSSQASNLMTQQIAPAIENFKEELSIGMVKMRADLASIELSALRGETNVAKLKEIAEFYLLVLKAQNFDRAAFWELDGIRRSTNIAFADIAGIADANISLAVNNTHMQLAQIGVKDFWQSSGKSRETITPLGYWQLIQESDIVRGTYFMGEYFHDSRFPLSERMDRMAWYIRNHNSILLQNAACALMSEFAHLGKNFLAYAEYLSWYDNWKLTNSVPKEATK